MKLRRIEVRDIPVLVDLKKMSIFQTIGGAYLPGVAYGKGYVICEYKHEPIKVGQEGKTFADGLVFDAMKNGEGRAEKNLQLVVEDCLAEMIAIANESSVDATGIETGIQIELGLYGKISESSSIGRLFASNGSYEKMTNAVKNNWSMVVINEMGLSETFEVEISCKSEKSGMLRAQDDADTRIVNSLRLGKIVREFSGIRIDFELPALLDSMVMMVEEEGITSRSIFSEICCGISRYDPNGVRLTYQTLSINKD